MAYTHVRSRYVIVGFLLLSFLLFPGSFVRAIEIEIISGEESGDINVEEIASSTTPLSGGGSVQTSATSSVIITIPGGETSTTTGGIEDSDGVTEFLISASNLLTNRLTNPTALVDSTPQFSAIYRRTAGKVKAVQYQLQISTTPTFSTYAQNSAYASFATPVSPNTRTPDIEYAGLHFASSTPYYWRIKFLDAEGTEGEWSTTTASFMLAASKEKAPTAPTSLRVENLLNPVDVTDSTPEFSAVYTDPNIGDVAKKYRIQIATTDTFMVPVWDSGTSVLASSTSRNTRTPQISYSGTGLASTTSYYWRIKLWDTYGNEGVWSTATSTFSLARANTRPTIPTALLLEGGVNQTNVTDSTPEFSAIFNDPDTVDSARKYIIQVSTSTTFAPLWWDSGIVTIVGTTSSGSRIADIPYAGTKLASSTPYYWRIRFFDNKNLGSSWSTRASFRLK